MFKDQQCEGQLNSGQRVQATRMSPCYLHRGLPLPAPPQLGLALLHPSLPDLHRVTRPGEALAGGPYFSPTCEAGHSRDGGQGHVHGGHPESPAAGQPRGSRASPCLGPACRQRPEQGPAHRPQSALAHSGDERTRALATTPQLPLSWGRRGGHEGAHSRLGESLSRAEEIALSSFHVIAVVIQAE